MTHSTMISLSSRTLQLATLLLLLAAASRTFGGEPVSSGHENQLIGQMVVSTARERVLIGHIVVSAGRLSPVNVSFADLGAMSVTATRAAELARNETSQPVQASL
jgi:hypothetical protein